MQRLATQSAFFPQNPPSTCTSWHVPRTQNPEMQAPAPTQGAAFGCLAAHVPLAQNEEVQSMSPPQLIPFCRKPHAPSMQRPEVQSMALAQGFPSGCLPQAPSMHTPETQSAGPVQAFPSSCLPQAPSMHFPERQTPSLVQGASSAWPQMPLEHAFAVHSWGRAHGEPFFSGPQTWLSVSHTPDAQSPSPAQPSPVVFPWGATQYPVHRPEAQSWSRLHVYPAANGAVHVPVPVPSHTPDVHSRSREHGVPRGCGPHACAVASQVPPMQSASNWHAPPFGCGPQVPVAMSHHAPTGQSPSVQHEIGPAAQTWATGAQISERHSAPIEHEPQPTAHAVPEPHVPSKFGELPSHHPPDGMHPATKTTAATPSALGTQSADNVFCI